MNCILYSNANFLFCLGFIFIVNPFKHEAQKYWIKRCLQDFTMKPGRCNLDAHQELQLEENIWQSSLRFDYCIEYCI